ncbi:MAG: hypothetical protein M3044_09145 [Thermoproteota archaeon]|nr:hypothetical protein [Thermoproteota archaeon]
MGNLIESQKIETMPWYIENFDSDLEKELDDRKIINDGKFLDLGTGPATQAIWLVKQEKIMLMRKMLIS